MHLGNRQNTTEPGGASSTLARALFVVDALLLGLLVLSGFDHCADAAFRLY